MTTVLALSDAVWGRLDAVDHLTAYDGHVPATPASLYAVLYPDAGRGRSDRNGGVTGVLDWGCYVVCAGRSRRQAVDAADLVRAELTGFSPDPSDAASMLAEVPLDAPVVRDDTVPSDIRFSLTLRFAMTTSTRS